MKVAKICWALLILSFNLSAQRPLENKIDLSLKKVEVTRALQMIEDAGEVSFSYSTSIIDPSQKISGAYVNTPIQTILDEIFGEEKEFLIRGSYVIIKEAAEKKSKSKIKVSGTIVDALTGQNIQNATIYEIDKLPSASLTDASGAFDISVATKQSIKAIAISKANYIDTVIYLTASENGLDVALQPTKRQNADSSKVDQDPFLRRIINKANQIHTANVVMEEIRPFQFSITPVLGSNGQMGGRVVNVVSINSTIGYAYGLKGVEFGGIMNVARNDAKWVQIGGFANSVGGRFKGTQIGGFYNLVTNDIKGVQIGGAYNYTAETITGTQVGGAANLARHTKGVQLAGAINYSRSSVKGLQFSGAYNMTDQLEGVQISGGINKAKTVKGIQLGVINFAEKYESGIPIGMMNFVKEGFWALEYQVTNTSPINVSFKSGLEKFYAILDMMINPASDARIWSYGMGFGSHLVTQPVWFISLDAKMDYISQLSGDFDWSPLKFSVSPSFGFGNWDRFAIMGSPSLILTVMTDPSENNQKLYNHLSSNTFRRSTTTNINRFWSVGYQLAIRI